MRKIDYLPSILGMIINFFFFFFLLFYIQKFGISSFILQGVDSWRMILNICIWYVLVMYCIDKFFDYFYQFKEIKKNE